MLVFLSVATGVIFLYLMLEIRCLQGQVVLSFLISYQLVLLISTWIENPLDIFITYDTQSNRYILINLNLLFYLGLVVGVWRSKLSPIMQPLIVSTKFNKFIIDTLFYYLIITIVLSELFFFKITIFGGSYDNDKPGYFFEYITVMMCIYYQFTLKSSFYKKHFPNLLHMTFCLLAGERMMLITSALCLLYSLDKISLSLRRILYVFLFVLLLLVIDGMRSMGDVESGFISKFIFDGEVTHHGSLLYSSLLIVDYASSVSHNLYSMFDSTLFILGLDGSTQGLGKADLFDSYGKRGGGGLYTAFSVALFGQYIGIVLVLLLGYILARILIKKNNNYKLSYMELIFISFFIHGMTYTPVLFIKPIIFGVIVLFVLKSMNYILIINRNTIEN
jgi:hypothetical protein